MHISSTCDEFPLKITVKINVIKLNKTKSKIADRINFLLFKSIWKKQIIKKLLIKKINPSCINSINGNKKIIKRIIFLIPMNIIIELYQFHYFMI